MGEQSQCSPGDYMTALTLRGQDNFGLQVRIALLRRGETITQLAARLGYARNTVSMAINHGVFQPVRARIRQELGL
jgi:hypothetical protein